MSSKSFLKQSAVTGLCAALRMSEADSSLKSMRLACISECEHHNGAEPESLDEVGSDRSLRCLEG